MMTFIIYYILNIILIMLHQLTYLIFIVTLLHKSYYYYVHFKVEKTESQKGKNNSFEVSQKVTDPLCKLLRIISGIMLLSFVNKVLH